MEDLTGKTIRGYELQERIGEGGFGVVYRAFQPAVKRDVVVKAILPIYINNADFIRNFEAEAQLIARLEHLHIVPLYDFWRGSEGAFLVMRWLRGGSLLESLAQGPWQLAQIARLLNQMAGALTVAHRNLVIHQDIKPANILLDDEGNAFLSDFGLAKDVEHDIDLSTTISNSGVRGSPAYISPEQIKRSVVTPQTDIYSLGLVLYELLCGEHPFDTRNVIELLRHQLNTQLPSVHNKRPDLPDKLNILLWKATAKEPDIRHHSILELAADFQQILTDSQAVAPITNNISALRGTGNKSVTGLIDLKTIDALATVPPNPYKGLRAFQEADAADFFGRDKLIQVLLQRFKDSGTAGRFLAVVGPSGSGKSSVVRAGLLPAIRGQWPHWYTVTMTPGMDPLNELADAIQRVVTNVEVSILEVLKIEDGLHQILSKLPDTTNDLVLIIDQFEEVFTHHHDDYQRTHFLNLIENAITRTDSRLRVVITLRADFYDRPLLYPSFGNLMRQRTEVVLPLSDDELREAIISPAARAGLSQEAGLVEHILADIADQPGILPLLQFTLTELYEHRQKNKLTVAAYEEIGGITGALSRRADELYQPMNTEQRLLTCQIFLRLVTPGDGTEDTRRRSLQSELTSLDGNEAAVETIITQFGIYRLLTFDRDPATRNPTVEIAHEALIRSWDQLREWLGQNRADLRTQRQLSAATYDWIQQDRDSSFLATGVRLDLYENLYSARTITLNEAEQDYVEASKKRRLRNQKIRQGLFAALIGFSLIVFLLAIIANDQRHQAEVAREFALDAEGTAIAERDRADLEASISRSRELAASARISADQIDLPLLLSLEALTSADTFEARNSLLSTLQLQPRLERLLHGHTDAIRTIAYSNDGKLVAAGSRDETIHLWDTVTGQPITLPNDPQPNSWINAIAFSPDNRHLAVGKADGSLFIIDLASNISRVLAGHTDSIWSIDFSPDSNVLVSASEDNTIQRWDISSGEALDTPFVGHENTVYAVRYSPDGSTVASGSADGTIRLWDVQLGEERQRLVGHTNWVMTLDFSPDGGLLASGSADGTVRLWDVGTGNEISRPLQRHTDWVRSVLFTSDGARIISGGADGFILIWDVASSSLLDGFANIADRAVWDIAISPDNQHIVAGGELNALPVWSLQPRLPLGELITTTPEQLIAINTSEDGRWLAYAGGLETEFAIKLYNRLDGDLQVLTGHTDSVTALAFHPTQPVLASSSLDRSIIIWNLETGMIQHRLTTPDSLFSLAFSSDSNYIAAGNNAGEITLWNMQTLDISENPQTLTGHTDRITTLAFHPNNLILASGSRDQTIRLWDAATGQLIDEPLNGHTDGILDIAFNPAGTRIASASRDTTIRLWVSTAEGWVEEDKPLTGHENWVLAVRFSPDGTMLASASGDKTIRLWDTNRHQALGAPFIGHADWVNALSFGGENLYSAGRDGRLVQWATGLLQWQSLACHIANRNLSTAEIQQYFQGQTPASCPP